MPLDRRSFLKLPAENPPQSAGTQLAAGSAASPSPDSSLPAHTDPSGDFVMLDVAHAPRQRAAASLGTALGISAGLEAHTGGLAVAEVKHALRRSGFGAEPEQVASWSGRTAAELSQALVDAALAEPLPSAPSWSNEAVPSRGSTQEERRAYRDANNEWLLEYRMDWMGRMLTGSLRERMALIWHNHFVTGVSGYLYAVFSYRYVQMLREHALGNLRDFVHAVGKDPAMLIYLNGIQNRRGAPNENYARELLELFTMGPVGPDGLPNYSEDDIRELARALTGWQVSARTLGPVFSEGLWDDGDKTIFGRTGAFGYDDAVALLFEERGEAIAHFVCRHLYESLVYAEADEQVVADLAALLVAEDFELAPVVRTLISSAHFFDPAAQGAQIKSPLEHAVGMAVEIGVTPTPQTVNVLYRTARANGQNLLDPPNVAGWPGHHDWINTTTLPYRWFVSEVFLGGRGGTDISFVPLAERITDTADPENAFRLPLALVEHLIPAPVDLLDIPPISDEFGGDLVTFPVPSWVNDAPAHVRDLAKMFLAGLPWYEWSPYVPGAEERMSAFVRQITQYPEFQLA